MYKACLSAPAFRPALRVPARRYSTGRFLDSHSPTSRCRSRGRTRCWRNCSAWRCDRYATAVGWAKTLDANASDAVPTTSDRTSTWWARRKGASAHPTIRRLPMNSSPERSDASVDRKLLEILVCPLTKGPLEFDAARQELISRSAKLAYPIRDGIPIMLPEEARKIE